MARLEILFIYSKANDIVRQKSDIKPTKHFLPQVITI